MSLVDSNHKLLPYFERLPHNHPLSPFYERPIHIGKLVLSIGRCLWRANKQCEKEIKEKSEELKGMERETEYSK